MTASTSSVAESWPLVLAGPMPRRVAAGAVSVFVACKNARSVRLALYDGTAPDERRLIHRHEGHTVALGRFLHVAMVTARPPSPLPPGRVYGYDVQFVADEDDSLPATADLESLGLLDRLAYSARQLPSFVVPPERLDDVRIIHGSCRKPQGGRRDALATLDQILSDTSADAHLRPQQLFLTGDQIYADEADPALLWLSGRLGSAALGWEHPERLPDVEHDDFLLAPTRRDPVIRHRAGYTGAKLGCHLMSLAEFFGMYLLVWSDELWPRDRAGNLTVPPLEQVFDHPRWRDAANRRSYRKAMALAAHTRPDVLEFVRTLPRVRRALANVATYMMFDDHDVTDDWNLHRQWQEDVYRRPLGRRMVQNALTGYAVFQGWGNDPDQYAVERPGGRLLAALQEWDGTEGSTGETIAATVGLPAASAVEPIRWDYQLDTPSYQVIVLDTRTQRGHPAGRSGRAAPALLSESAMQRQLAGRFATRDRDFPLTIVVSAAPVFGHPLIEAWVQLKRIKAIEWFPQGPAAVDREAWSLNRGAFEALLALLAACRRVVILSGDVHYGFAGGVDYWDWRDGERRARFVQLTSSALKGEDLRTRFMGGVPTVRQGPAFLGSGVERMLSRLTNPPPMTFVGWPADPRARWLRRPRRRRRAPRPTVLPAPIGSRVVRPPEWRYRMNFQADMGAGFRVVGRTSAAHRKALQLRTQYGWSFMHCIVGRNNLGDVEFLLADGEPSGTPSYVVRQSLWFDKTSIRSGREPARLPYTVYDLPLALPGDAEQ